jgi:hypothetical protein
MCTFLQELSWGERDNFSKMSYVVRFWTQGKLVVEGIGLQTERAQTDGTLLHHHMCTFLQELS